ncbi:MAG: DUF2628 domain-containing protein [Alphaproteobacteria bacterium]|nr:DUF2628 domain-containing protein [Alphaproteobacteria bacterium]
MTRLYAVFERRTTKKRPSRNPDDAFEMVKEGFCWPALFFGPLWALASRMWVAFALLAAAVIGLALLPDFVDGSEDLATTLSCLLALVLGFLGNDLRQWSLARGGYEFIAVVSGSDLIDAERRFFAAMNNPMFRS